jgi:glutaminase
MAYQDIIDKVYRDVQPYAGEGRQADYIPALAEVNPEQFGMCIESVRDDETACVGDADVRFSIQSISKVFMLAMCLSLEGDQLWQRMGKEPSGNAFNSLVQLEYEHGKPRNPFINAGALVMADVLISRLGNPESQFINFVRQLCGSTVDYNHEVARSEMRTAYLNTAIANLLKHHGNIHNHIRDVLHFYFLCCSVEMSCRELAHAFRPFADHHAAFAFGDVCLTDSQVKRINAIMQTCGFYDEAGEFSYLVGLPGKSGVGGGIAAIYPQRYAVAVWSPRLNPKGNSVVGMKVLELLTTETKESIF